MKKSILTLLIAIITHCSMAQTENSTSIYLSQEFEKNYNAKDFNSIFLMFNSNMQKAFPLEKTKDFLAGMQSNLGNILKREFIHYEKGTFASYKTNFERGVRSVNISADPDGKINGLLVKEFIDENFNRNSTKLILPFDGVWTVIWGGDTKELNYHVESRAQKNAFDILIKNKNGLSYKTNGKENEDYYAFGKELKSPCEGEVILVVDGVKDNSPGEFNLMFIPGNTVIIKTKNNEFLFFAHFKNHSITVKEGQKIGQGQLLGLCGNSGHSSEPHLHFHIQNVENMNEAIGVKCFFNKININGQLKDDYSPIQGDQISNF